MKYLLFILFLTANLMLAQVGNTTEKGATLETGTASTPFLRASGNSGKAVTGSEYLNEEWEQATIKELNIKKKVKLLARFNAYTKEIEILKEKDIVSLTPINGVSVELYGKTFVPVKLEKSPKAIFAEQLVDGNAKLYKVYDIKISKAASDATLLNIDNSDKLKIIDKLYYQKNNGAVSELPTKKKLFEALLDERSKKLIKAEKLSIKKEKDLVRIFQSMNDSTENSK